MKCVKLILSLITVVLSFQPVIGQTYGVWAGAKEATFWNYDLTQGSGSYLANTADRFSVSTANGAKGFLPLPISGSTRVSTAAQLGGGVGISNSALTITGATANSPVKFSAYNIEGASPVTSLFFDINFNITTATNGVLILGIGKYAQGQVFNNTNQLSGSLQNGIFAGVKFEFYGGSTIQSYLRSSTFTYNPFTDHTSLFTRTNTHQVEIYCNNSASTQSYLRKSKKAIKIPSKTYQIYVDGKVLDYSDSKDLPATGELEVGQNLDSFIFCASNSSKPTPNSLNFSISNIKVGGLR